MKISARNQLFVVLIILNIVDFITTYVGINYYGRTEQNPVMSTAILWMGTVWAVLIVKAIVFGGVYYRYYYTTTGQELWSQKRTVWMLVIFNVLFAGVVINNVIRILIKM